MIRFLLLIFLTLFFFAFWGCVSASDSDDYDDIHIGKFSLSPGSRWVYEITRGSESYTDSALILDILPYEAGGSSGKFLYLYREPALNRAMLFLDTAYVKLIEYDGDRLMQFGREKRDRSEAFFLHEETEIFDEPYPILDHSRPAYNVLFESKNEKIESVTAEKIYIGSLLLLRDGHSEYFSDTLFSCIKIRHIFSASSQTGSYPSHDIYIYYTDLGILKIEGFVNGSKFLALANEVNLK